jgi:hypothetical protein
VEPEEDGDSSWKCDSFGVRLAVVDVAAERGWVLTLQEKELLGCGGTRELGVKQWLATLDGRRTSRFGLGG